MWKNIVGYDVEYQINEVGTVRTMFFPDGRERDEYFYPSIHINGCGYKMVHMRREQAYVNVLVHRLVAMAFIGNIPSGYVVDHKNEDRSDCRLENLQLLTNQQNISKSSLKKGNRRVGVSWTRSRSRWKAHITINKKTMFICHSKHHGMACFARAYIETFSGHGEDVVKERIIMIRKALNGVLATENEVLHLPQGINFSGLYSENLQ